jgi:hypothetical protein
MSDRDHGARVAESGPAGDPPRKGGRAPLVLWLSALSTLAYLAASDGIHNYLRWLLRVLRTGRG